MRIIMLSGKFGSGGRRSSQPFRNRRGCLFDVMYLLINY